MTRAGIALVSPARTGEPELKLLPFMQERGKSIYPREDDLKLLGLVPAYHGVENAHPDHRRAKDRMLNHQDALMQLKAVGIDHIVFRHIERCSMLPMVRSLLAAIALAEDADYIFWVDDDIWWRVEDVCEAVRSDLPIVGFPCFHKPEPDGRREFKLNYDILDGDPVVDPDKDWRHVLMIGTGAMVVKAEVFRAQQRVTKKFRKDEFVALCPPGMPVVEHLYEYFDCGVREMKGDAFYCGEDVAWCLDVAKLGYPTFMYCRSVTAHMLRGSEYGSLCDYLKIREDVRAGVANELVLATG